MRKTLIILVSLILTITWTTISTAQDGKLLDTGVGFAFGKTCGNGFSIKHLPETGFGYQGGTIYYKSPGDTYFQIGAELLYSLNRATTTALYLIVGMSYEAQSHRDEYWDNNRLITERNREQGIAGGVGMGISYNNARWERIWWSADLVIAAYHDTVLPYPQFAVHYLFK